MTESAHDAAAVPVAARATMLRLSLVTITVAIHVRLGYSCSLGVRVVTNVLRCESLCHRINFSKCEKHVSPR